MAPLEGSDFPPTLGFSISSVKIPKEQGGFWQLLGEAPARWKGRARPSSPKELDSLGPKGSCNKSPPQRVMIGLRGCFPAQATGPNPPSLGPQFPCGLWEESASRLSVSMTTAIDGGGVLLTGEVTTFSSLIFSYTFMQIQLHNHHRPILLII